VSGDVPEDLWPAVGPVLDEVADLTERIRGYDREIEVLSRERFPEAKLLQQVPGVGPITALAFVLTLEDPARFSRSRMVGSYLGLRPRQRESGSRRPELRITKEGDEFLRWLLVQAAHYIVGRFGPDTDLRRWGLRLLARGGKHARQRAAVAVARKLAVLLHQLWVSGSVYEPLRQERIRAAA
jgi:transposase